MPKKKSAKSDVDLDMLQGRVRNLEAIVGSLCAGRIPLGDFRRAACGPVSPESRRPAKFAPSRITRSRLIGQ